MALEASCVQVTEMLMTDLRGPAAAPEPAYPTGTGTPADDSAPLRAPGSATGAETPSPRPPSPAPPTPAPESPVTPYPSLPSPPPEPPVPPSPAPAAPAVPSPVTGPGAVPEIRSPPVPPAFLGVRPRPPSGGDRPGAAARKPSPPRRAEIVDGDQGATAPDDLISEFGWLGKWIDDTGRPKADDARPALPEPPRALEPTGRPEATAPSDPPQPPEAGGPEATDAPAPPWYTDYDALGDTAVDQVDLPDDRAAAEQLADRVVRALPASMPGLAPQDVRKIHKAIRERLGAVLTRSSADDLARNPRADIDRWTALLEAGISFDVAGHLIWLHPVLRDFEHVPEDPDAGERPRRYPVSFASTSARRWHEKNATRAIEAGLHTVVGLASSAISSVFVNFPRLLPWTSSSHRVGTRLDAIAGRKSVVDRLEAFTAGVDMRVFVDGERVYHDTSLPGLVTVPFPEPFLRRGENRARPNAWRQPRHEVPAANARNAAPFHLVVNALAAEPFAVDLQKRLLGAGIPARSGAQILREALPREFGERAGKNRAAWWTTAGQASDPMHARIGLFRSFRGHARTEWRLRRLEFEETSPVVIRDDLGLTRTRRVGSGFSSGLTGRQGTQLSGIKTAHPHGKGYVHIGPALGWTRSHGLTADTEILSKTTLQRETPLARYRALVELSVRLDSATHRERRFDVPVMAEVAVPVDEAVAFEQAVLGEVRSDHLRPLDPAEAAKSPAMRALHDRARALADAGPGAATLIAAAEPPRPQEIGPGRETPPELPDAEGAPAGPADAVDGTAGAPSGPGGLEPLPLAAGRGTGLGVRPTRLPGAERVLEEIRGTLFDRLGPAVSRSRRWAQMDRELDLHFGPPALAADITHTLTGIPYSGRVAGHLVDVMVTGELGAVLGTTEKELTVNTRGAKRAAVSTGRTDTWDMAVEVDGRVRLGGAHPVNAELGRFVLGPRHGRSASLTWNGGGKGYNRTETEGPVLEVTRKMTYRVAIRIRKAGRPEGDGRAPERVLDGEDMTARIAVPLQHRPVAPPLPADLEEIGRFTEISPEEFSAMRDGGRLTDLASGAPGLYPSIVAMPDLAVRAGEVLARLARGPAPQERWDVPAQILEATRSSSLEADVEAATGADGILVELPRRKGWHYAERIRMHAVDVRYVRSAAGVEREHYVSGSGGLAVGKGRHTSLAGAAAAALRVNTHMEDQAAQIADGTRRGTDQVRLGGTVKASLTWSDTDDAGAGGEDVSRATYDDDVYTYRSGLVFEITAIRWKEKGGRVGGIESGPPSYFHARQAMDFMMSDRAAEDLGLPRPDESDEGPAPEPAPARTYAHPNLATASSYPERLEGGAVLPAIVALLKRHKVLSPGEELTGSVPMRILRARFTQEALRRQHLALLRTGVLAWIPVDAGFGVTRYAGVRVRGELSPATGGRPRPDATLMLRSQGAATRTRARRRRADAGVGGVVYGSGFVHGGFGSGIVTAAKNWTRARDTVDRYGVKYISRVTVRDRSHEFTHDVRYTIEVVGTTEPPAGVRHLASLTRRGLLGVGDLAGGGDALERFWYDRRAVWTETGSAGGSLRLLVPEHATKESHPDAVVAGPRLGRPVDVRWGDIRPGPVDEDLAPLLGPVDFAAAPLVETWAPYVTVPRSRRPADPLTARRPPGFELGTGRGIRLAASADNTRMRADIGRLLAHDYVIPQAKGDITVGVNLHRAVRLTESEFKARNYTQVKDDGEHDDERITGHGFTADGLGGDVTGAHAEEGEVAPFERSWHAVDAYGTASGNLLERNEEVVRGYDYYAFDLTLSLHGPGGSNLAVTVEDGFVGRIAKSDVDALKAKDHFAGFFQDEALDPPYLQLALDAPRDLIDDWADTLRRTSAEEAAALEDAVRNPASPGPSTVPGEASRTARKRIQWADDAGRPLVDELGADPAGERPHGANGGSDGASDGDREGETDSGPHGGPTDGPGEAPGVLAGPASPTVSLRRAAAGPMAMADGRPVAIWLPGTTDGMPTPDARTIGLLSALVPPETVFVFGTVRDGRVVIGDEVVEEATLHAVIAGRAPGKQPFLLMPGSAGPARALAGLSGGPVLAAPFGARLDAADGTLRPEAGADAGDGAAAFWLYEPDGTARAAVPMLEAPSWRRAGQEETHVRAPDGRGEGERPPARQARTAAAAPAATATPEAAVSPPEPDPAREEPFAADPMVRSVGVPRAGLPALGGLIEAIRAKLGEAGRPVAERDLLGLVPSLVANYPYLLGAGAEDGTSGFQVSVGAAELLITLDPDEPRRVHEPAAVSADGSAPMRNDPRAVETVNGVFATGVHAQTHTGQMGATRAGLSLMFGAPMTPTVMQVIGAGMSVSGVANRHDRSTTRIVDAETGHVEDTRIRPDDRATLLSYAPNWSFKLRTDPARPWADTEVNRPPVPDSERLLLWVPDHYLRQAPPDQVTATGDRVKVTEMPESYFASGITGIPALFDEITTTLRGRGLVLPLGGATRAELLQKLGNLNAHLDEAVNDRERGYPITLHDERGRPVAIVTVHSERAGGVVRVGETSKSAHLENVRTAIDGGGGAHSLTNSSTVTPLSLEFDLVPNPLKVHDLGLGVSTYLSYTSTNVDAISAGGTGLWVVVPRYRGYTAAYRTGLRHRATVSVRDGRPGGPRTTGAVEGSALIRMSEPDAYEHGFPVDRTALKKPPAEAGPVPYTADDAVRNTGRAPGDPVTKPLPSHVAAGKGVGMGIVRVAASTVREMQARLKKELRAAGFLPADEEDPFAGRHWYGHGDALDSQIDNLDLLEKMVSARGLDSHYDQNHQDGMTFTLRRRRGGAGIDVDVDSAKITIMARRDRSRPPRFIRSTHEYHTVNLAMGFDTAGQSVGYSHKLAWGVRFKALFRFLRSISMGVEFQRTVGAGDAVSFSTNRPELLEYPGVVDEFALTSDYEIHVEYQHADVQGRIRHAKRDPDPILIKDQVAVAHLLPLGNGSQEGPTSKRPTPSSALDHAVVYYLDTTGARDAAATALTDLTGPAAAGDLDIGTFAGTIQMRAHLKEILNGEYSTDRIFAPGLFRDTLGAVDISGKLGRSTFAGATDDMFVLGIIKMWLAQNALTDTGSNGLTWDQLDAAFGGVSHGAVLAGEFDANRHWQHNRSRTSGRTGGKELIQLDFSRVYAYRSDVSFTVAGRRERRAKLFPTASKSHVEHMEPRTVMYLLPEPEALTAYADGVLPVAGARLADAMDRWRKGRLRLPGDVIAKILLRWREEAPVMPEVLRPLLPDPPDRSWPRRRDDWDRLADALAHRLEHDRTPIRDREVRERFNDRFDQTSAEPHDPYGHVDMPQDLVRYASGALPVAEARLADAMDRWRAGELRLSGDVAARILMRWHDEVAALPADVTADHGVFVRTLFGLHRSGAAPVRSRTVRERLNEMFAGPADGPDADPDLVPLEDAPVPLAHMELPEYLTRRDPGGAMLGHSGMRDLSHANGKSTYQIVKEKIDEVAPGMLTAGAEIWDAKGRVIGRMQGGIDALRSILARGRDQAMWEDVLARDGYRFYLVNPIGWLFSDVVEVVLADVLTSSPHVYDFRPDTGLENYGHGYTSTSTARSRDGSQTLTLPKFDPSGARGGASTGLRLYEGHHRGTTRAETSVAEQTVYDWSGHYLARFDRELTVTVRRLRMPGRPLNNLLARRFAGWTGHGAATEVTVPGSLELQVPRALAEAGAQRGPAGPRDLTPLPKPPGNAYVSGALLDDMLPAGQALLGRLFRPGPIERLFDARAGDPATRSSLSLPVLLSRSHLTNHLRDAVDGRSEIARDLFIPGDAFRRATLWLAGDLYDAEVVGVMDRHTGTGRYGKHQSGTTAAASTDHGRLQADASADTAGTMHVHHRPDTWTSSTQESRLTAGGQGSAGTENYRREQHVKELGRTLLIRVSGRFRLFAQRYRHHLFHKPTPEGGLARSDPVTGDVYMEMFESQYEEWRAQAEAERARAQQRLRSRETPAARPAVAPRFDLAPLLADAARKRYAASNVHRSIARSIRAAGGGGRPVILSAGPELTVRRYRAVLEWAVRTIEADLREARTTDPAIPDPPELRRYRHHREVRADTLPSSLPRPADDEIGTMIALVNRVHELRPDNPLGAPAALPREVSLLSLDPVMLARNVADELDARVRVDIAGPGGRVVRRWAGPDGRVHAFSPAVFEDVALPADVAKKAGLLPPELYAEVREFGLDGLELGRLYRSSWDRQQTFEQAVAAELAERRERLRPPPAEPATRLSGPGSEADHAGHDGRRREVRNAGVPRAVGGGHAGGDAGARSRVQANTHLVAAVNLELKKWRDDGRTDHGSVEAAEVERGLSEIPPGGPTDQKGIATDIASQIAYGTVSRMRAGAIGRELETRFTVSGLPDDGKKRRLVHLPELTIITDHAADIGEILEIVEEPVNVLSGETGRLPEDGVTRATAAVLAWLDQCAGRGMTIQQIFGGFPEVRLTPDARDAVLGSRRRRMSMYVQHTVGVPVTGMHDFMRAVIVGETEPRARHHAVGALRFGDDTAAVFTDAGHDATTNGRVDLLSAAYRDVAIVRSFMTLVYTQVAAVLEYYSDGGAEKLLKNGTVVASRVPLANIRKRLPDRVRDFLRDNAGQITDAFQRRYAAENSAAMRHAGWTTPSDILRASVPEIAAGLQYTVGDYLKNALVAVKPRHFIDQDTALSVTTQIPEMDDDFGRRGTEYLVPLEIRVYGKLYYRDLTETNGWSAKLAHLARRLDYDAWVLRALAVGTGCEVEVTPGADKLEPRELEILTRFADLIANAAVRRYRASGLRPLVVRLEGGSGDPRQAQRIGLDRARAVVLTLEGLVKKKLHKLDKRNTPPAMITFVPSTRGNSTRTAYPYPWAGGSSHARPHKVAIWMIPNIAGRHGRSGRPPR